MMIYSTKQIDIYYFLANRAKEYNDMLNKIGPFQIYKSDSYGRKFNCSNYDSCLTYAANKNWDSFSCEGCRKTSGGTFI